MGAETQASEARGPLWKQALLWLLGIVLVGLLVIVAVHVMIPPVASSDKAPAGHFKGSCVFCHIVTGGNSGASVAK